jgi:hypothetical protein
VTITTELPGQATTAIYTTTYPGLVSTVTSLSILPPITTLIERTVTPSPQAAVTETQAASTVLSCYPPVQNMTR